MRFLPIAAIATALLSIATASVDAEDTAKLCFPENFLFGTATASYQIEGGWNEGGRTPSIWDDYCRKQPTVACANVADDFFHRYVDDIKMMRDAGHKIFRFSVSWSRVMNWDPATKHMKPNPPGLAFYHSVVDELRRNGIAPVLTIFHWDLPVEFQTELSAPGWLTAEIQPHFVEFATLLYKEFGHKVDFWTTFNEPWAFTMFGYSGNTRGKLFAPGLAPNDHYQYIAAHNVLISHAKAVKVFRELKSQNVIGSKATIAIVMTGDHNVPLDPTNPDDVAAADRTYQFTIGWFLEPTVSGNYPEVMRKRVGDRLPKFTPEEITLINGSYDIFNLNHYSTHQVTDCSSPRSKVKCENLPLGWARDLGVDNNAKPVEAHLSPICDYFSAVPEGYRGIIRWMSAHNKTTPILLTENGYCGDADIDSRDRLWYHQSYLEQVHKAITEDKIPILGYTAWSLMDNYEWGTYKPRFGLYYVNYTSQAGSKGSWNPKPTELARIPRLAAKWYASLAQTGCMDPWKEGEQVPEIVPMRTSATILLSEWHSVWAIAGVVVAVGGIGYAVVFVRRHRGYTAF